MSTLPQVDGRWLFAARCGEFDMVRKTPMPALEEPMPVPTEDPSYTTLSSGSSLRPRAPERRRSSRLALPVYRSSVRAKAGTQSRGRIGSRLRGSTETFIAWGGGPLHLPSNGDIVLEIDDIQAAAHEATAFPLCGRGSLAGLASSSALNQEAKLTEQASRYAPHAGRHARQPLKVRITRSPSGAADPTDREADVRVRAGRAPARRS